MSLKIDGKMVLRAEPPRKCEMCGTVSELRPYGPNGEFVCFNCGMANENETKRMFLRKLNGIKGK